MATEVITGSCSIEQRSEPPTDIFSCLFSLLMRFPLQVHIFSPGLSSPPSLTISLSLWMNEGERVNEKRQRLGMGEFHLSFCYFWQRLFGKNKVKGVPKVWTIIQWRNSHVVSYRNIHACRNLHSSRKQSEPLRAQWKDQWGNLYLITIMWR